MHEKFICSLNLFSLSKCKIFRQIQPSKCYTTKRNVLIAFCCIAFSVHVWNAGWVLELYLQLGPCKIPIVWMLPILDHDYIWNFKTENRWNEKFIIVAYSLRGRHAALTVFLLHHMCILRYISSTCWFCLAIGALLVAKCSRYVSLSVPRWVYPRCIGIGWEGLDSCNADWMFEYRIPLMHSI